MNAEAAKQARDSIRAHRLGNLAWEWAQTEGNSLCEKVDEMPRERQLDLLKIFALGCGLIAIDLLELHDEERDERRRTSC